MKTIKFLLVLLVVIAMASPAYALVCEMSQALGGGDACYTQVRVSSDSRIVSQGTVLCYDFTQDTAAEAASHAVQCTVSADTHRVIGTAKNNIASGDVGLVQVWGKGRIVVDGVVASGDRLYTSTVPGSAAVSFPINGTSPDVVGMALEASTGNATIDAVILAL